MMLIVVLELSLREFTIMRWSKDTCSASMMVIYDCEREVWKEMWKRVFGSLVAKHKAMKCMRSEDVHPRHNGFRTILKHKFLCFMERRGPTLSALALLLLCLGAKPGN